MLPLKKIASLDTSAVKALKLRSTMLFASARSAATTCSVALAEASDVLAARCGCVAGVVAQPASSSVSAMKVLQGQRWNTAWLRWHAIVARARPGLPGLVAAGVGRYTGPTVKPAIFLRAALCALLSASTFAASGDVGVQARDAWIRWLPGNIPSAAYLTLVNSGTAPQVLVGAASPDFAQVSFHQTRTINGISEMSPVSDLRIDPQHSLQFAPGGYHIMLMQALRDLHPGDRVSITLRFAGGKSLPVLFEVRSAGAEGVPGVPR